MTNSFMEIFVFHVKLPLNKRGPVEKRNEEMPQGLQVGRNAWAITQLLLRHSREMKV